MSSQPTTDHDTIQAISQPSDETPKIAPRRRGRRIVLISLAVVALIAVGGIAAGGLYLRSVAGGVKRIEAFDDIPAETRPEKIVADVKNLLILGSDTRDPNDTSGSRSDTIILAHLPKGRESVQLISIPRDTWLYVPQSKDGRHGGRDAKINAAFAWGGVPLMVQTVERYTGVRIDNVAIVDFSGFKEIVDALGGVEITVETAFTSTHSLLPDGRREFKAGTQVMDGAAALDYARERFAFTDGDFARIRHQQQVIRAILDKAASGGVLANPARLNSFLKASADAVTVDDTLNIFSLAAESRHLRSGNLTFVTNPTKGTGTVESESVVFDDKAKAKALYDAVRGDDVPAILNAAT